MCSMQVDIAGERLQVQPSWVVVEDWHSYTHIDHGQVPQDTDMLPLSGESTSCSGTVEKPQRTHDGRVKGTGCQSNTASTSNWQHRCVFLSRSSLFTEDLGHLLI